MSLRVFVKLLIQNSIQNINIKAKQFIAQMR